MLLKESFFVAIDAYPHPAVPRLSVWFPESPPAARHLAQLRV